MKATGNSFFVRSVLTCFIMIFFLAALAPGQAQVQAAGYLSGTNQITASIDKSQLQTLDPATAESTQTNIVSAQIMETLLTYDPVAKGPVAGLATAWTRSADGLTWTFTLRDEVKFQDGTDLTGMAVQANFERWWDSDSPLHGSNTYPYFEIIFGPKNDLGGVIASMESNASQFILHLNQPMNTLPIILTNLAFAIASPSAIAAGQMDTHPVGTGAYKLQSWNQTSGDIDLTEFTGYWGEQPYIPDIHFRNLTSAEEKIAAIQNNTLDIAYGVPFASYAAARQDVNVYVTNQLDPSFGYMGMNQAHGALADLRVRQAIAHAIDKEKILAEFYAPFDAQANQTLPSEIMGNDASISDYDYDLTEARDLLAQAGYTNGFSINLEYRTAQRLYLRDPAGVAQAIKSNLAQIGIHVNVIEQESSTLIQRMQKGDVDLFLLGWIADFPHPDNFLGSLFCSGNLGFGAQDVDFCASINTALDTLDPTAQRAAYEAASRHIHETLPLIPLASGHDMIVTRAELAGLEKTLTPPVLFRNLFWAEGPSEVVQPEKSASILVSGQQVVTTTINVPQGAVDQEVVLSYALVDAVTGAARAADAVLPTAMEAVQAGPLFKLAAYTNSVPLPELTFLHPIELTMKHDRHIQGMDPNRISLSIWEDGQWQDAGGTCVPLKQARYDAATETFHFQVCKTGTFRLSGAYSLFVPLIFPGDM